MDNKKINLDKLKVQSFVTSLNGEKNQTIKGGKEATGEELCTGEPTNENEICPSNNTCPAPAGCVSDWCEHENNATDYWCMTGDSCVTDDDLGCHIF